MHGPPDVLALNIGGCPHTAQREEDGDESFNKRAQLGATNRVIIEDSEDYCQETLAMSKEETKSGQEAYPEWSASDSP